MHAKYEASNDILETESKPGVRQEPSTTQFLKWRLAVVESQLRIKSIQRQAFAEASSLSKEIDKLKPDLVTLIREAEKALISEKIYLLTHRKVLEEDLNDTVKNKDDLQDAYIIELRLWLDAASTSKDKLSSLKSPRLDPKRFQQTVDGYLGTKQGDSGSEVKFCNVLGFWLAPDHIKCAHIVPFSWNTKEMAHMFGSDEPPHTSRRNGLSLQSKIEEAFDNCWIAIVPIDPFQTIPTEWKVVLLNSAEKDNTFFTDILNITDRRLWRWRDIDGRKLTFLNDNRPARRFLYMRYALAWLHADDNAWPAFKDKVPSGEIWASPHKPDGYLRKSILVELGKKTGDRLPKELISVGTFEDPDTSNVVYDEVAGIRVVENVRDHLDGVRDTKEDEEDDEDEGSEDE